MSAVVFAILSIFGALFRSQRSLRLENAALRHQLAIYQRTVKRPRIRPADRLLWSWLSRRWARWREALVFVRPETVIAWQRKRFRDHWTRLSRAGKPGRPPVSEEIRQLIRKVSGANPLWGTPRIVGELKKLGVLAHSRRKVLHFNVTENPTVQWTAQQIIEAFPWDSAPKYLFRDRDAIYGAAFQERLHGMGIEQVLSAPRSPWQNPFVERLIGTLRRDCLDHVIVVNDRHLRCIVGRYLDYYHNWRTHLSLSMDAPNPRAVHPPERGRVVAFPECGGLHHHYERLAA